jgi:hypothetical protein
MSRSHEFRFENPRLRVLWAAITALQPDEVLELALSLQKLLGRPSLSSTRATERVADAIACLRQVADLLGRSPSVREYETVKAEQPELELVASSGVVWTHRRVSACSESTAAGSRPVASHPACCLTDARTDPAAPGCRRKSAARADQRGTRETKPSKQSVSAPTTSVAASEWI